MNLIVISPEGERADEIALLDRMCALGLRRYHVRKPGISRAQLEAWLESVPPHWRARLTLHQHHDLTRSWGLAGRHWPEREVAAADSEARGGLRTRACHDLPGLQAAVGHFDAALFSPVFASISKPGHTPGDSGMIWRVSAWLRARGAEERRTAVFALGGIDAGTAHTAFELGFDGVAALGAIWRAPDPIAAFRALQHVCGEAARAGRELENAG